MEPLTLTLQITINKPADLQSDHLTDHLTDYIYKYHKNGADIQTIQVTKLTGEDVD